MLLPVFTWLYASLSLSPPPAVQLKRPQLQRAYQGQIDAMYKKLNSQNRR